MKSKMLVVFFAVSCTVFAYAMGQIPQPEPGLTKISDAAIIELSGATTTYFTAPAMARTNILAIAEEAGMVPYTLHFSSTNQVVLSANMVPFGELPEPVAGRMFGFSPYTNDTWLVIGVAP